MFSQDWSGNLKKFLDLYYTETISEPKRCLEIGSFEGRGSIAIHEK